MWMYRYFVQLRLPKSFEIHVSSIISTDFSVHNNFMCTTSSSPVVSMQLYTTSMSLISASSCKLSGTSKGNISVMSRMLIGYPFCLRSRMNFVETSIGSTNFNFSVSSEYRLIFKLRASREGNSKLRLLVAFIPSWRSIKYSSDVLSVWMVSVEEKRKNKATNCRINGTYELNLSEAVLEKSSSAMPLTIKATLLAAWDFPWRKIVLLYEHLSGKIASHLKEIRDVGPVMEMKGFECIWFQKAPHHRPLSNIGSPNSDCRV